MFKGTYPRVYADILNPEDFYPSYIQTYIERDLRQILNVANLRDFRRFLSFLAIRVGQLVNYSDISREIGVAVNTIKSWISALETSGIIVLLPPYYKNLGKRLIKAPKLYFCDNGIVASLLNISTLKALNTCPHLGNIWENFVLTEYLKEGYRAGKDLFYFRDQNGVEIDFIVEKEGEVFLVEAKHSERPDPTKLNFNKIAPRINEKVTSLVACGIEEKGIIKLKEFSVFNPFFRLLP